MISHDFATATMIIVLRNLIQRRKTHLILIKIQTQKKVTIMLGTKKSTFEIDREKENKVERERKGESETLKLR